MKFLACKVLKIRRSAFFGTRGIGTCRRKNNLLLRNDAESYTIPTYWKRLKRALGIIMPKPKLMVNEYGPIGFLMYELKSTLAPGFVYFFNKIYKSKGERERERER